jgi:hypothetical protein
MAIMFLELVPAHILLTWLWFGTPVGISLGQWVNNTLPCTRIYLLCSAKGSSPRSKDRKSHSYTISMRQTFLFKSNGQNLQNASIPVPSVAHDLKGFCRIVSQIPKTRYKRNHLERTMCGATSTCMWAIPTQFCPTSLNFEWLKVYFVT